MQGHLVPEDSLEDLIAPQTQVNYRRKAHREPPSSIFRAGNHGQSQKFAGGGRHGPHLESNAMRGDPNEYEEDFGAHNHELDQPLDEYEATHEDATLDAVPNEEGASDSGFAIRNPQS